MDEEARQLGLEPQENKAAAWLLNDLKMHIKHPLLSLCRSGMILLTVVLLFAGTFQASGQSGKYPVMIAFTRETGFMMDSAEVIKNDLFPFLSRAGFQYLVVLQTDSLRYRVNAIYGKNEMIRYEYPSETIYKEWLKVSKSASDTGDIKDYQQAQIFFPDISFFAVLDTSFKSASYSADHPIHVHSTRFYIDGGLVASSISSGEPIQSLQLNGNLLINKILLSVYYQGGESKFFSIDYFGGPDVLRRYRELSFTSGYVVNTKDIFVAFSTGITHAKIQEVRYESAGIFASTIAFNNEEYHFGIPIVADFSFPSFSAVGFSLKAHTTFVFDCKPTYHIGIGIRFGRTTSGK